MCAQNKRLCIVGAADRPRTGTSQGQEARLQGSPREGPECAIAVIVRLDGKGDFNRPPAPRREKILPGFHWATHAGYHNTAAELSVVRPLCLVTRSEAILTAPAASQSQNSCIDDLARTLPGGKCRTTHSAN
jgi:hypothetical protein